MLGFVLGSPVSGNLRMSQGGNLLEHVGVTWDLSRVPKNGGALTEIQKQ